MLLSCFVLTKFFCGNVSSVISINLWRVCVHLYAKQTQLSRDFGVAQWRPAVRHHYCSQANVSQNTHREEGEASEWQQQQHSSGLSDTTRCPEGRSPGSPAASLAQEAITSSCLSCSLQIATNEKSFEVTMSNLIGGTKKDTKMRIRAFPVSISPAKCETRAPGADRVSC